MNFAELAETVRGELRFNEPMKEYTTWKIGGPADCLLLAADGNDVAAAIRYCREREIPYFVLGNGSNLLVRDGGIEGLVIRIGEGMKNFTVNGTTVTADSGCVLSKIARETAKLGLSGLEYLVGIPASLGGAAYMNAGAFGHYFYEVLREVEAVDENGELITLKQPDLTYSYRRTALMDRKLIVTKVVMELTQGDAAALMQVLEETAALRRAKQPLNYPSCGSVFKNPEGNHAGYLVELCGLRGFRMGDAMVSEIHGNFIINLGNCTAAEMLKMIAAVQAEVKAKQGYELEPEVLIVGRD